MNNGFSRQKDVSVLKPPSRYILCQARAGSDAQIDAPLALWNIIYGFV